MADTENWKVSSSIGRPLVAMQFELASKKPAEALQSLWVLGYCFGTFDALAQRAKLDQYTEGLALITIGFLKPNELPKEFDTCQSMQAKINLGARYRRQFTKSEICS